MERASRVLGRLQLPVTPEQLACRAWPSAVGRTIAANTRAARMVRSNLIVEVEDNVWQRQLFALRHQIKRKLEASIGPGIVEEIEFRVLPRRREPQRATVMRARSDEADGIEDPVLRKIYKSARRKETA